MNRTIKSVVATTASLLLSAHAAYGASFGDMFSGKKVQEYKMMLEEKEQQCQAKLNEKDVQYQQLAEDSKDARETVQGLRDKNATLMEAYEKLKNEQDNILTQLTRLRRSDQRCDKIKTSYDTMAEENKIFVEEKESLIKRAEMAIMTVENLKAHLKEVTAEKDQLAVFLAEAQEDEDVKVKNIRNQVKSEMEDLKKQAALFKEEKSVLAKQLDQMKKQFRVVEEDNTDLNKDLGLLQAELDAFEKDYKEIRKENKHLAREATQFPVKFADLARHNRKLVKETADMHYNLGVSKIKEKEYKRAAKEFEKVLELKPDDAYANYNLGYIYAEHLVDREKAIDYFQKYLTYEPKAKDANWVRQYVLTWQTWYNKKILK